MAAQQVTTCRECPDVYHWSCVCFGMCLKHDQNLPDEAVKERGWQMNGEQITTTEAARLLGVRPVTIRSYIARGYLTPQKYGRDWLIRRAQVDALASNPPKRTGRPKRDA